MIEVNLLPQEFRKKPSLFSKVNFAGFDIKNIPIVNIAAGVGAAMVLAYLILFLVSAISSAEFASVSKRYNAILPDKKEADALKAKVADINKRSRAMDELMLKRFNWARKLNALSDCMTSGVWLSELYYDEKPVPGKGKTVMPGAIVMSGYTSGGDDHGAAIIGKFIKSLQDNKDFYSDMDSVNLVSTKTDKVDNQDVMSFTIVSFFK